MMLGMPNGKSSSARSDPLQTTRCCPSSPAPRPPALPGAPPLSPDSLVNPFLCTALCVCVGVPPAPALFRL